MIECKEFYELCQKYRHAESNEDTCVAYQNLINYIDKQTKNAVEQTRKSFEG